MGLARQEGLEPFWASGRLMAAIRPMAISLAVFIHSILFPVLIISKAFAASLSSELSASALHNSSKLRSIWPSRQRVKPIKLVRQSVKRETTPDVLELAELQPLLSKLLVRERTLALLHAAAGVPVSELRALRWSMSISRIWN